MRKLRLGVIGAGSWAVASHLPVLVARGDVEPVAVCRQGADVLARIQAEWGFALASEDYRDVLDAAVDLMVISSPTALHYEHARAALEAGSHVLVEKPFTLTGAEAWELVDLAERLDRRIVVAFGFNYRPVALAAEELLARHGVGRIESLAVSMASGARNLLLDQGAYPKAAEGVRPDPATWTDPALSGGGYAQAQLSHGLGVALRLTGLRAERVFALMNVPDGVRVEIDDAMTVAYRGGAIGTVTGVAAHPGFQDEREQFHVRVVGDEGHLDLDFDRDEVRLFRPDVGTVRADLEPGAGSYDCVGPPNALADLALGRDVSNRSPGELGARTAELLEASYASARSGMPELVGSPGKGSS